MLLFLSCYCFCHVIVFVVPMIKLFIIYVHLHVIAHADVVIFCFVVSTASRNFTDLNSNSPKHSPREHVLFVL